MADRFRYSKTPIDPDAIRMQRETEDNFFSKDKNGDLVFPKDIRCRSIYVEGESVYIGGVRMVSPIHSDKDGYWKYDREVKQFNFTSEARPEAHAERHEVGGDDLINHDDLTGFVGDEHIPMATVTVEVPQSFETYSAVPSRAAEHNVHGGILKLADAQQLGPTTPGDDVSVEKGIGKILIVVNAGTDLDGTITLTGNSVDRNTGVVSIADDDTIIVDALTTDDSTQDTNTNDIHKFTGAYITAKWFTGTVVLSSTTLNLSDIDVYHVSFEQFGDNSGITLNTFDANILTLNVAAEFDAYLYTLHVTGSKCNVDTKSELHVGADGETAIANQYWRLRKGNIDEGLDGTTDGFWMEVHYANSPVYVEDVTIKVWYTISLGLTY